MFVETVANRKAILSKGGNVKEHLNGTHSIVSSFPYVSILFVYYLSGIERYVDLINSEGTRKLYCIEGTEKLN